ncbi:MAG: sensor histidine kinase [Bacteroidales bacterium]
MFLALLTSLVPRPQEVDRFEAIIVPALFYISFYYLNFFVLASKFFIPRRYIAFFIICLLSLILTITIPSIITGSNMGFPFRLMAQPGLNVPDFPMPDFEISSLTGHGALQHQGWLFFFRPEYSYTIIVFLFILTLSTGIRITLQWQQAEKEKVNAELAFLKAQLNPHFLFNTLNNIYSMAVVKNEKTSFAIEKFSNLMRFVLYETQHDFVPLSWKLEYIDTYIELQKLRFSSSVTVNYNKSGNSASLQIAPLMMMPFIENAFKHGVSTEKESVIIIKIDILEDELNFYAANFKNHSPEKENGSSQLGIGNTIKRLQLIYPGRHTLRITENEHDYIVELNLHLK